MFNFHVVYTEHAQESVAYPSAPSQLECQQCNEQCHNIDWSDPEHEAEWVEGARWVSAAWTSIF
jgi:hypothetical protein